MGLTIGTVGCVLPFAVVPLKRKLGGKTYLWSDYGYSCSQNGYILNKPKDE